MYNNNEGPQLLSRPATTERVCNGCKFLDRKAMLRGHDRTTDNYYCIHPDFENEKHAFFSKEKGKAIHHNHEGNCTTPDWCPFLKK